MVMSVELPEQTDDSSRRPWLTVGVSVTLLALQVILLDRFVGEEMLGITETLFGRRYLRKELLVAVLAAVVVLQGTVRRHLPAYRLAPLAVSRLAWQGVAFASLFGFLVSMASAVPQGMIGEWPSAWVATAFVALWLASLILLLPPQTDAAPIVAGAAFVAAVMAAGIALADFGSRPFWNLTVETTMQLVTWLIAPFAGGPVIHPEPTVIGTEKFTAAISPQCSGWQGIFLIITLFTGYLWWFRSVHRFPQAFLLFPLGILLIFSANVVRIAALILVGIWISPTIAVDGFHSQAGWVAFLVVGLGLIWAAGRIPFFLADADGAPGSAGKSLDAAAPRPVGAEGAVFGPSVVACLIPFLALLVTTIVTGLFSAYDRIDVLYPIRVFVVGAVLWVLRHEFRWRQASVSPVAVGLGVVVFAVWMFLAPMNADPDVVASRDPAQLGPLWGPLWLIVRVLGYTMTVPIAEELAFRGFLARRLIDADVERVPPGTFSWISFLGSSLAFGALHQAAWIPGTLAGMAFAAALYHRRRLRDAIVAHTTTNALLSVYVIGTGSWASWG
jgi:exosortase E/protease (VPEID-CTERM system)